MTEQHPGTERLAHTLVDALVLEGLKEAREYQERILPRISEELYRMDREYGQRASMEIAQIAVRVCERATEIGGGRIRFGVTGTDVVGEAAAKAANNRMENPNGSK